MKFNISKEWLKKRVDLEERLEIGAGTPVLAAETLESLDCSLFPVKEMFKRNWFEGFAGSLAAAKSQADILVKEFLERAIPQPVLSLQRQRVRAGAEADPYALLAWQCRVLLLANLTRTRVEFKPSTLTDRWLTELVHLSRLDDGPVRARRYLADSGIKLVIEPHLPSTHLDGAAMLSENGPVIGLTLRYDRTDNFWFVLLHEIIHIKKHLKKGAIEDIIFDDLDASADEIEHEADSLAAEALIPSEHWESALPRFIRSEEAVVSYAAQLRISPAIVAGRIQREANDYILLKELVGRGAVRKLFAK